MPTVPSLTSGEAHSAWSPSQQMGSALQPVPAVRRGAALPSPCQQPLCSVLYVSAVLFWELSLMELIVVGKYLSPEMFTAVFTITNNFKQVDCLTVNTGYISHGVAIWWDSVS